MILLRSYFIEVRRLSFLGGFSTKKTPQKG